MATEKTAVAAFNMSLRLRLIVWIVVILALVVAALTTLIARRASEVLETQTRAQLAQITAQSARTVGDFLDARARTTALWANDSLLLAVARDPGLRAVFMPGLATYLNGYAEREPWIYDIIVVEDRVPIFALSGRNRVLSEAMSYVTLTSEDMPARQIVRAIGDNRRFIALREQAVDDGQPLEGIYILLILDPEVMHEVLLADAAPSASGFVSLLGSRGSPFGDQSPDLDRRLAPSSQDFFAQSELTDDFAMTEVQPVERSALFVMGVAPLSDIGGPIRSFVTQAAILGVGAILLGFAGTLYFTGRVTAPIRRLTTDARSLARARFGTVKVAANVATPGQGYGQDEVGELASVFELLDRTTEDLTHANALLEDRNRALSDTRERLASNLDRLANELDAARQLQLSMVASEGQVQRIGPASSIGRMTPAREVGGDFFESLALNDHRVLFFIGDVSDKGTASALLMSRTVSLLRFAAQQSTAVSGKVPTPSNVLAQVNQELCRNNSTRMFVTVFLGILDTRTGEVTFANAGHMSPLRTGTGTGTGTGDIVQITRDLPDLPLGVKASATYATGAIRLTPKERLVLYTDGVTEAENSSGVFFGLPKLKSAIGTAAHAPLPKLIRKIETALDTFVGQTKQFDDITLLVLGWEPIPENRSADAD
ncbi:SpoIIE family protein phosphatase [Pseudaestuariivita sp.]|uniref:SpoIIE family protein phosphatase n=1 Tax=Pseudaestuariivita sp. TaxID=2211669 RepID=UPI0040588D49